MLSSLLKQRALPSEEDVVASLLAELVEAKACISLSASSSSPLQHQQERHRPKTPPESPTPSVDAQKLENVRADLQTKCDAVTAEKTLLEAEKTLLEARCSALTDENVQLRLDMEGTREENEDLKAQIATCRRKETYLLDIIQGEQEGPENDDEHDDGHDDYGHEEYQGPVELSIEWGDGQLAECMIDADSDARYVAGEFAAAHGMTEVAKIEELVRHIEETLRQVFFPEAAALPLPPPPPPRP
jgi:chromosome segregation ATPase